MIGVIDILSAKDTARDIRTIQELIDSGKIFISMDPDFDLNLETKMSGYEIFDYIYEKYDDLYYKYIHGIFHVIRLFYLVYGCDLIAHILTDFENTSIKVTLKRFDMMEIETQNNAHIFNFTLKIIEWGDYIEYRISETSDDIPQTKNYLVLCVLNTETGVHRFIYIGELED